MSVLTSFTNATSGADAMDTLNGQITRVAALEAGVITRVATIPAELGWNNSAYPIVPKIIITSQGGRFGDAGMHSADFFPNYTSRPTYWVNVARADDTGDGLAEATAKRTIARAIDLANAGGVPARIRVKGGFYNRNRSFSQGGTVPTVDIVFEAYSGRVIAAASAADLVWTANATYPHVTQATVSNVSTAWDLKTRDADGFYGEFTKLATLVDVAAVPNSWAEVAGVYYEHRADRAAASDANSRVMVAVDNLRLSGTSQQSILLIGETSRDGFDLEGGQAGCWRTIYTGGAGGALKVQAAVGCTFRYGGHSTGAVGNVAIEGLNGLAFFENCDASNGVNDCWNFHNALAAIMAVLMVNCTGIKAGKFSYVSCNGLTAHDLTLLLIDICGVYDRNRGRTIHLIGSSKAFLFGSNPKNSLGDKAAGGSNEPGELTTEDSAVIIGQNLLVEQLGSKLSAGAYGTSSITLTNTPLRGAVYADPGSTVVVG